MLRLIPALLTLALVGSMAGSLVGCDPSSQSGKARDSATRDASSSRDLADNADKDLGRVPDKDADKKNGAKDAGAKDDGKLAVAKEVPWVKPEDRNKLFLDFNMTDQSGEAYNLKQTLGKPTVGTFIFTRCPSQQMCPLQAKKIAWLQEKLEKEGLGDKINFVLISFDPDYDTPARLKTFGEANGVDFTNARMLRPTPAEFPELMDEFAIRVGFSPSGEIQHKTDMFILDHKGYSARMTYGMWDDQAALKDVKRLLDEMEGEGAER